MKICKLSVILTSALICGCQNSATRSTDTNTADANTAQTKKETAINSAWPDSLDAVAAAPGNHKVVLENDKVRVLDVTVRPGEREPVHGHRWPSVLYVIAEDNIRDYDAAGNLIYDTKTDKNPTKAPYTIWMEPQPPHSVENLSEKPLRLLRVELKQ